jgi:AcrR family transcriptional regulator
MTDDRGYHHGALRRAVLDAALEVIATGGPGAVSLRDLARRAGVSHAAPAHHFKDKAGLLTAIAVEGFDLLAEALTAGNAELLDQGVSYVRFALDHPAHFEVMFRPDLCHTESPELRAARARTARALSAAVSARTTQGSEAVGVAAWALAHGFATLWATGSLPRAGQDGDPLALFRTVAQTAFR